MHDTHTVLHSLYNVMYVHLTRRYDPLSSCLVDFKGRATAASVKNFQLIVSTPESNVSRARYYDNQQAGVNSPKQQQSPTYSNKSPQQQQQHKQLYGDQQQQQQQQCCTSNCQFGTLTSAINVLGPCIPAGSTEEDTQCNAVVLQMGRVGQNCFNMDLQWPMSVLQAFATCLTRFDTNAQF
jgi:Tub family